MVLLSFVKGSKSASGYGPGGPYPLADLDRGGPVLGGSKSARTPVILPTKKCSGLWAEMHLNSDTQSSAKDRGDK